MLVKSSAESTELAFNTAEYCCKKLFKSEEGGRYNKWYCYGVEFGQNYAWFKVEHTDYSVRLSFEFMDTGFVYVDGYFTNGSSYDKKTITSWRFDNESEDVAADKVKDVLDRFFDEGINVLRGEEVINSRRPIKSANYNGFNLEARRSYGKGNGYFTTYPVWDTDLDTSIGAIEYHYAVENPYYVAWVYNDFGANKTGRTKAFDTEEECLEWIGEELASGTTARDKLLKYWEELGYDYKSKNLNNSRKPVKSSFIVGKQDNGTKVYFCEDGKYYSENDYSRPSIKIFDSKSEADKMAKRSKSGFVSPLEK